MELNSHHRLRLINSASNPETFTQTPRKTQQRLIPLTREIRIAMMDFNGSQSNISISEAYTTISITNLVENVIQNILQELSITDQFIRKEEIDNLIEKCLKEKGTIIKVNDNIDLTKESDMTAKQLINENDQNELIIQNFEILEHRLTNLEERLSKLIETVQNKRFKQTKQLNINALKDVIQPLMAKINERSVKEKSSGEEAKPIIIKNSIYDDIYYTRREYILNLLNYKKSLESVELNEKSHLNPYVKPLNIVLPKPRENRKQTPMFLIKNDV